MNVSFFDWKKVTKKSEKWWFCMGILRIKHENEKKMCKILQNNEKKMKQDYKKSLWNKKKVIDKITFLR